MSDRYSDLEALSESRGASPLTPHRLTLVVMWVVVSVAIVVMLLNDVRSTDEYKFVRHLLHAGYVGALLLYLGRSGLFADQLIELRPQVLTRRRLGAWIPALGIAALLTLTLVSDDGVDILMLLMIVATVWILLAWRRQVRLRSAAQGFVVALVAFLAALEMANNGFLGRTALYLLPALSIPMYVAGGLLIGRTRLGGVQLLAGRGRKAMKSLLWGCLLFVPLGLINAADGSPGSGITWVTEWWQPLWLPWSSGITEEIWFRLFLVGLVFFLLRPACRTRPAVAVVAAVLFSGIVFGVSHGRTLERLLTTGLLYGVPMAAIFARRDWEHAVGAHYMVNMIPWVMVYLDAA